MNKEELEKNLENLGSTPDEVAQSLRTLGIKGSRMNSEYCPIAEYIHKTVPGSIGYTGISSSSVYLPKRRFSFKDGEKFEAHHPQPVRRFILDFDSYAYPDLDSSLSD